MNSFRIIEMVEGKEAADGFEAYIESLNLKSDIKEKISVFDLTHPLYQHGFHPALALHMIKYNEQITAK